MARTAHELARELDTVAARLQQQGQSDLVKTLNSVRDGILRALSEASADGASRRDMLTTTEAAAQLGVRSINTIKRWASEGRLEGYRLGSRVLVSRRSVEQMLEDGTLRKQRAYEQGLEDALAPFGSPDEDDLNELTGQAHRGRKPWEARAAARV